MKKNTFISIKKILAILILAIMLVTPVTSKAAFSFWPFGNKDSINTAVDNKYADIDSYKSYLNEAKSFIEGLNTNMSVDDMKIDIIDKITELQEQENYSDTSSIPYISNKILNETITSTETDPSSFLSSILSTITSFIFNSSFLSIYF